MTRLAAAVLCALALQGCAAEVVDSPEFGATESAIFSGDLAAGGVYDAVGSVHFGGSRVLNCSGTLVRSDALLTAAHCVLNRPAGELWVQFDFSADEAAPGEFIRVTEVIVHPDFNIATVQNDLAVLRLGAEVGITPVLPLPVSLALRADEAGSLPIDVVGFGIDQGANMGVRKHKELLLGSLGCTVAGCPSDPIKRDDPTVFSYTQSEGGPCTFDSGGPAFVVRGGVTYVAGATSNGDSACVQYGTSVSVAAFENWLFGVIGQPPPMDAGVPDASIPDASIPDASVPDAGIPDASTPDASVSNVGIPDAGAPDSSVPDAGIPEGGVSDMMDGGITDAMDRGVSVDEQALVAGECSIHRGPAGLMPGVVVLVGIVLMRRRSGLTLLRRR